MKKDSSRRKRNWKSREKVNTIIDDTEEKKIKVDFGVEQVKGGYDASNALVLPSTKRKTIKRRSQPPIKLLSKKHIKRLKKIVELKEKKLQLDQLVTNLQKFQAKSEDLKCLTSLQETQTLGRKVFLNPSYTSINNLVEDSSSEMQQKHLKWKELPSMKKARREAQIAQQKSLEKLPNYAGYASSSSDESDSYVEMQEAVYPTHPFTVEIEKSKFTDIKTNLQEINLSNENLNRKREDHANKLNKANKKRNVELEKDNKSVKKFKQIKTLLDVASTVDKAKFVNDNDALRMQISPNLDIIGHEANHCCDKISPKKNLEIITITPRQFKILKRTSKIQKERRKLPILSEEHTVMEAINENLVTIIVGPTGSGKTTQVPQFLYEAGYVRDGQIIGVTEPRRVAAISMSERVGYEMGLSSKVVSYQVRFDGNQSEKTQIKFMTDGILLKEIQTDKLLQKYSVLVIDEAHERNVQSDVLIGLLSNLVRRRKKMLNPLKLVIMSATLRIEDFTENVRLFKISPPIVKIDARVFAVTIYFNKITDADYIDAAFKKVYKIHKQLPEGTILVFLSGQNEIHLLAEKLKEVFPQPDLNNEQKVINEKNLKTKKRLLRTESESKCVTNNAIPEIDLANFTSSMFQSESNNNLEEEEDYCISKDMKCFKGVELEQPMEVLPLYSRLPAHQQRKVFQPPPPGARLCVLTTNIAETSLTIPNVKYVVDSGKIKQKVYDHLNGVSSFKVVWTSKASSEQRAGRAGRVCNGHCYRLYSSAVYNDEFEEYSKPEILRKPIDDVVLILKSFGFSVSTFPFPTPPNPIQLQQSIKRLISMGALQQDADILKKLRKILNNKEFIDATKITELGKEIALIPVSPRFAKIIVHSNMFTGIMPYVILIISALTFPDFLIDVRMDKKYILTDFEKRLMTVRTSWSGKGAFRSLGDLMIIINAILEAERYKYSEKWCEQNGVRFKDVDEIRKLRQQLTKYISDVFPSVKLSENLDLEPLSMKRATELTQVILTGSSEFIAKKVNHTLYQDPLERAKWKNSYRTIHSDEPAFISSLSILHKDMPQYIMYQDIHRTTKTYLRGVSAISSGWLMICVPSVCVMSPPLVKPPPRYIASSDTVVCTRKGTFGPFKWELPETETPLTEKNELYKWVSYYLLKGDICPILKKYTQYLYDIETFILPICVRYRDLRENLIRALQSRNINNRESLEAAWKQDPLFLKKEYFAWFHDEYPFYELSKIWPPIPQSNLISG